MSAIDTSAVQVIFDHDYHDRNTAEEISRNVRHIVMIPKGSMPGSRGFGLDTEYLSLPPEAAMNLMAAALADAVQEYEPRASVASVEFSSENGGNILQPVITLSEGDGE